MNLDPKLLAFELVNFVVLMLILRRFLFAPVRETLQRRRTELEQRNAELAAREAAVRAAEAEHRERLAALEQQGEELRTRARRRGREEADELIAAARVATEEARARAEEEREERTQRALELLRPRLLELALDAALRVARDLPPAELVAEYARQAARELQREAPEGVGALAVRYSPEADAGRVEAALRAVLGEAPALELEADPELVAGVRLHAGDLEVEASAGASLKDWARELGAAA